MNKIYLSDEFDKFWQKIENKENFALLRYGDGERAIMCGEKVKAQEGWKSPKHLSKLGKALIETLKIDKENFYYGISCPCCDNSAYLWYMSRIRSKNITFANLWINCNYQKFFDNFSKLERDVVIICNENAKNKNIANLNIIKSFYVTNNCIKYWDKKSEDLISELKADCTMRNNTLYVVAAGPMSEPIITEMYKANPNNCYIDFGSSIDEFVHNRKTRPFMDSTSVYAQSRCYMYDANKESFDVSVVLNVYKKPESLKRQLQAILNQSLKPKEILLYQDGTGNTVKIPSSIKKHCDIVEINPENKGVWERFRFAKNRASSKYICVFDDDTIPQKRWLENCMTEMFKQEGLYGTIGIVCENNKYEIDNFFRVGWANPNESTEKVDFVGHSWFFKKEWLEYLFEDTEELQALKICGEDMAFSCKLQQHGIATYVPPHPKRNLELYGSTPKFGKKFGEHKNSLFVNNGWQRMSNTFNLLIDKYMFKTIENIDNTYFNLLKMKYAHSTSVERNILKKAKSILKYRLLQNIPIENHIHIPKFDEIDVSIIIPVYNQYDYTIKCINSIKRNTKNLSYEIIIVDDCSTDKTKNIEHYVKNIKVIKNDSNLGFVKSCNRGAKSARGNYIYLLNNDTFILNDSIKNLRDTFNSNIGIVGSMMISKDGIVQSAGAYISSSGYSQSIGCNELADRFAKKCYQVEYCCGASFMVARKIWEELNGLDEIYNKGYFEEIDFCLRAAQLNFATYCQPKSKVIHYENKTFVNSDITDIINQNRTAFLDRWKQKL